MTEFTIVDPEFDQINVRLEFLPDVQHYKITFSAVCNECPFYVSEVMSKESFENLDCRTLMYKRLKNSLRDYRNYLGFASAMDTFEAFLLLNKEKLPNNKWLLVGF